MTALAVLALVAAYLMGSVPAAAWLARGRGVDIRKVGSGNSGATNVLRSLGKGPALVVAVFDVLKGVLAVVLARALGLSEPLAALCGVLAVIGHNFSPFLAFRGGKGVATTFGTIVVLAPLVGLGTAAVFFATVYLTRFVSAGSMLSAFTAALLVWYSGLPLWTGVAISFLAALLIWQHRENIVKLRAGTERKFGEKVNT